MHIFVGPGVHYWRLFTRLCHIHSSLHSALKFIYYTSISVVSDESMQCLTQADKLCYSNVDQAKDTEKDV